MPNVPEKVPVTYTHASSVIGCDGIATDPPAFRRAGLDRTPIEG